MTQSRRVKPKFCLGFIFGLMTCAVDAGNRSNIKISTVPKHVRERAKRALSTETVSLETEWFREEDFLMYRNFLILIFKTHKSRPSPASADQGGRAPRYFP